MSRRRIPGKLTFLAKHGSDADRAKVSGMVDKLLDDADMGINRDVYHEMASSQQVPLNSNQIHRIIDSKKFDGMVHPVGLLARWRFGELKHEHWDKIVRTARDMDIGSVIPHAPPEHLRTIFNDEKRDPFLRRLAQNHYNSKYGPDSDELLKDLRS